MIDFLTNNGKYLIEMALRRISEKAYDCSVECCDCALNMNKCVFEAHFIKGCALYHMGDYEQAKTEFIAALRFRPFASGCYSNLAMAAIKLGDNNIIKIIKNATQIVNDDAELYMMLGILYSNIDEYDNAFENFIAAHKLRPSIPTIYINAGTVMLEKKNACREDYLHAVCCFTTAIKLSPLNKYAYYNRCRAYIKLNMGKEALGDAETLLFIDRNDAGFYYIYANALVLLGKYDEAVSYYKKADSFGVEYVSLESRKRLQELKNTSKSKTYSQYEKNVVTD